MESIYDLIQRGMPKRKAKAKANLQNIEDDVLFDSHAYLLTTMKLYTDVRIILFHQKVSNTSDYYLRYYGKTSVDEKNIIFIHHGYNAGVALMIPKLRERIKIRDDDICDINDPSKEFTVKSILDYSGKPEFKSYTRTKFLVEWKGYPEACNTWEPWQSVVHSNVMKKYIESLIKESKDNKHLQLAKQAIIRYKEKHKTVPPPAYRGTRSRANREESPIVIVAEGEKPKRRKPIKVTIKKTKKNNTGKKITFTGEEGMEGKGGVYAFLPFDDLDAKEKGVFKLGMTTNFKRREEQFHTYFPEGVYFINFLAEPDLPEWDKAKNVRWAEQYNKNKPLNKQKQTPSKEDKQSDFYKKVEAYIFKYVETHKGNRIYSTTRVKNPNTDKLGATEWFYTTEDVIHEAFDNAHQHFKGGILKTYYLEGLDPETGKMISIHDTARERLQEHPNYTGKIVYRI